MSAETMRRAAALMRERAEAATPGPWSARDAEPCNRTVTAPDPGGTAFIAVVERARSFDPSVNNAEHIASWHPAVALAVADWLARIAEMYPDGHSIGNAHALTVARTYLGSES